MTEDIEHAAAAETRGVCWICGTTGVKVRKIPLTRWSEARSGAQHILACLACMEDICGALKPSEKPRSGETKIDG